MDDQPKDTYPTLMPSAPIQQVQHQPTRLKILLRNCGNFTSAKNQVERLGCKFISFATTPINMEKENIGEDWVLVDVPQGTNLEGFLAAPAEDPPKQPPQPQPWQPRPPKRERRAMRIPRPRLTTLILGAMFIAPPDWSHQALVAVRSIALAAINAIKESWM